MRFRFYDYLEVVIDSGGHSGYARYFKNEYTRVSSPGAASHAVPVVKLQIVDDFTDEEATGEIVRTERFKKLFTFHYRISGLGAKEVAIRFKHHPVATFYPTAVCVYVQAHVLEPVMYLKMLEQRVLFMHAAGVSKDGKASLFPALGGTGKTTLSLSLLRCGFLLLGDDLLIVDPAIKTVFPYPRPLHLFSYNINRLRGAEVPRRLKIKIFFKDGLRVLLERILRTEFLISTRVHAADILPKIAYSSPSRFIRIAFLKRTGSHETVRFKDQGELSRHGRVIVESGDLNRSLYALLRHAPEKIEAIKDAELEVVSEILMAVGELEYVNTRLLDLDQPRELLAMFG